MSETLFEFTDELDCTRMLCPLPVIKTQNKIKELPVGSVIKVTCTDPGALHDIPAWCRVNGHEFVGSEEEGRECFIYVKVSE